MCLVTKQDDNIVKNVTVKNAVYGRLKASKGNLSFSELLEQIMNKAGLPPLQVSKTEAVAADTPIKESQHD